MKVLFSLFILTTLFSVSAKTQTKPPVLFKTIGVFVVDSAGLPVYWKADFMYRIVKDTTMFVQDTVLFAGKDSSKANIQFSKKQVHDTSYYRPVFIATKGKLTELRWIPINPAWVCKPDQDIDVFINTRKLKPLPEKKK